MRLCLLLVAFATVVLSTHPAQADVKQCVSDHTSAQEDDKAGRLVAARDKFRRCSVQACPEMIRNECRLLHTQTQNRVPTAVFSAPVPAGVTVTVSIDGGPPQPVTGAAVELDPGTHALRFSTSDGRTADQQVTLTPATKNHRVDVSFSGTPPPVQPGVAPAMPPGPAPVPPPPTLPGDDGPSYTGPIVMAAIGGGALVLFTLAAIAGKTKENELDGCKPSCLREDVDQMRVRYLAADIMLGVAGASLGAALIWWLVARGDEPPAPRSGGFVAPAPGGIGLGVRF